MTGLRDPCTVTASGLAALALFAGCEPSPAPSSRIAPKDPPLAAEPPRPPVVEIHNGFMPDPLIVQGETSAPGVLDCETAGGDGELTWVLRAHDSFAELRVLAAANAPLLLSVTGGVDGVVRCAVGDRQLVLSMPVAAGDHVIGVRSVREAVSVTVGVSELDSVTPAAVERGVVSLAPNVGESTRP